PVVGLGLSLSLPAGWHVTQPRQNFAAPIRPDARVEASFKVTSGPAPFNGDLVANASYTANGVRQSDRAVEKLRNVSPIKINEFRIGDGAVNPTNSFIELYNAGADAVDISNWSLVQHQTQQAISSDIRIAAGTT